MKRPIAALPLLLLLCSCDAAAPSTVKNIFGRDHRTDVAAPQGPLAAIGRLDSGCSGVRVGRRLVLTAAHCVVDNAGAAKPMAFVFRQDFAEGLARKSYAVDRVWYGTNNPDDRRERDFAVLKLAAEAATDAATPAIDAAALTPDATLPYTVSLAGFSVDRSSGRVLSLHRDCAVRARKGDRYLNDCDAAEGISGAPLLSSADADGRIVGLAVSEYRNGASTSVHRDEYSDDYANVALSAAAFAPLVKSLLASVDAGLAEPILDQVFALDNPSPVADRPGHEELAAYDWTSLRSATIEAQPGANSVDLAIGGSQRLNHLRVTFSRCPDVDSVVIEAITSPEGNDWEKGEMFAGEAARFSGGDIQFVRVSFVSHHQTRQDCGFQLLGALDHSALPSPHPVTAGIPWSCTAAPHGNAEILSYFWQGPSVDFARYQALSACTFANGLACSVDCDHL